LRRVAALIALSATVAFPIVLAACGSPYAGSNVGQQVQSWVNSSPDPKFSTAMSTLQGDLRRITEVQAIHNDAALRTDCDVLVTDALSANQNLPTPDSDLTDVLSSAYSAAGEAGKDCLCAAGGHPCPAGVHGRANLLDHSAAERSKANRGFIEAEARVDLLVVLSGGH